MNINNKVLANHDDTEIDFLYKLMNKIEKDDIRLMDKESSAEFQCSGFVYGFTKELIMFNER